jgi:parvulin-like peptidyl-prolyl isomerase
MMSPMIKRSAFFMFLCITAVTVCIVGCAGRDEPRGKEKKRVLAKVNKYEITADDLADEIKISGIAGRYHSGVPADKIKQQILDDIIIRQLLLEEAQKENLDKGREFLKEIENYWRQTLIKLLLNKKNNELQFVAKVTDDEITREYERFRKKLQAQVVALKDKAAAQELSAAGADFEVKLAGLGAKVIRKPQSEWWMAGELPYQIENIVFALKPGEVSKPFMVNGEWAVVKVIGQEEITDVKPLREIRGEIKTLLLKNKKEQELKRWFTYLVSRANIQRCFTAYGGINGE